MAIKKNQLKALEFALNHNLFTKHSAFSKFDFNAPGKKLFTPLHYAVLKSNLEAFLFLMRHAGHFIDLLRLDESFRTPRGLALINSPYFKILYKLEKVQLTKNNLSHSEILSVEQPLISKGHRNFSKSGYQGMHKNHRSFDFNHTY